LTALHNHSCGRSISKLKDIRCGGRHTEASKRRQRFEDLWAAAAEPEKAVEAARRMLRDNSPGR
jgi:hypothetical protein